MSFLLSPALVWTGDGGYPDDPAPQAVIAGGIQYRRPRVLYGISARTRFNFTQSAFGEVFAGGEIKILSPSASFVTGISGGFVYSDGVYGGFAGISLGFIGY